MLNSCLWSRSWSSRSCSCNMNMNREYNVTTNMIMDPELGYEHDNEHELDMNVTWTWTWTWTGHNHEHEHEHKHKHDHENVHLRVMYNFYYILTFRYGLILPLYHTAKIQNSALFPAAISKQLPLYCIAVSLNFPQYYTAESYLSALQYNMNRIVASKNDFGAWKTVHCIIQRQLIASAV